MTTLKAVFYPAILAAAAALLPASIHAEEPARFALTIGLEENGAVVANPRLEVAAGGTATVELGDERAKTYNFAGTVTPMQEGNAIIAFRYTIQSQNAEGFTTSCAIVSNAEIQFGKRMDLKLDKNADGLCEMGMSLQVDVVQ
jgi:hypothetical protein